MTRGFPIIRQRGLLTSGRSLVRTVIPDSGDLHARYDATELTFNDGENVSTWDDETGHGHDLTAGTTPTFKIDIINGNPVVRFDGVDDFLEVVFNTISQPVHYFVVFKFNSTSSFDSIYDAENSGDGRQKFGLDDGPNNYRMEGNTVLDGGTPDTSSFHIGSQLFNSTNSEMRIDGSTIASGDAGMDGQDGFTVGADRDKGGHGEVDIGEMLVYPYDKSGIQADVETYLSDKWGIAI